MAKSIDARLARLEAAQTRRNYRRVAAELGIDPDELLEEGEMFFAMSLSEQLAEVDALAPELIAKGILTAQEIDGIRATLRGEDHHVY